MPKSIRQLLIILCLVNFQFGFTLLYAQFTNVALCINRTGTQEFSNYTYCKQQFLYQSLEGPKALLENGRQPRINLFSSK